MGNQPSSGAEEALTPAPARRIVTLTPEPGAFKQAALCQSPSEPTANCCRIWITGKGGLYHRCRRTLGIGQWDRENQLPRNSIQIRRSLDGGTTWEPHTIPIIQHDDIIHHDDAPGIPFEDKPYIG